MLSRGFTAEDAPPGRPSWGEAEAWLYLADSYAARGDRRRVRNAVERALLAAPDYADALRLRARLLAPR